MSCSVKISSGKSWSGSQRRISSLAEENTCPSPNNGAVQSCALSQTIQTSNNVLVVSSQQTANYNNNTNVNTTSNTIGNLENLTNIINNPSIVTTSNTTSGISVGCPPVVYNSTVASSNIAGVFGAGGCTTAPAAGGIPQRIPTPRPVKSIASKKGEDTSKLLKYIDDNVIGKNGTFFGPFGRRKVVFCDYTATGRSLQFLEEYIAKEVLPCLGDTRSSTSICSLQSSLFRHEARDIVRHAVGAGDQDAVLFTGQGSAGALRTLLRLLDLSKSTVVFVGPFEHHDNLQPWREYGVKIVRVSETREGFLDLNELERGLAKMRSEGVAQMIGCFSAASCITGVLADDVATTLLLHQYGALSIWDYTTAAPYTQIDMNPHLPGMSESTAHKDAIFFAGHKFVGGVQSPGVLVSKQFLLMDEIRAEDMRDTHRYLNNPELRDESGTAGVVESIRCGLAIQLKENVTPRAIVNRQDKISRQVLAHVRTIPELILLGSASQNVKRLPIFSFMVRHPRGTFLHHNFVCAVLNDVFGIQARSGCACVGRYAHNLMGIDTELAKEYENLLMQSQRNEGSEEFKTEALRPGFAKLSFPYFMSEAEVAFILEALKMVATEGWKLLPQYVLNPNTGEWRHHTNGILKERKLLGTIRYTDGKMNASERRVSGSGVFPQSYSDCLQTARNIFNRARKMAQRYPLQTDRIFTFISEQTEQLRWFMLPNEAQDLLLGNSQNVKQEVPFNPCLAAHRFVHTTTATSTHDSLVNSLALANGMRRLNSDIPRTGNIPISQNSPRHRSLPALSTIRRNISTVSVSSTATETKSNSSEIDDKGSSIRNDSGNSTGHKSPATCPSSPMPVRFAVGEAVTPSALSCITHAVVTARPMKEQRDLIETRDAGRARCNSLGSTTGTNNATNRSGMSSSSSPIPVLPLSPQTLTSLGLTSARLDIGSSKQRRLHCSCSSQTELNSLELEAMSNLSHSISSFNYHNVASPPSSYSSVGEYTERFVAGGRSSPIYSNVGQRSDDDLSAYLKEVTKELATEIKSEIREVISKVDDALSEANTSENTPQHHSRNHNVINQISTEDNRQLRHDSFTASDIAEYLMEFSKEMASEVKSEIRCMVNAVDGLHRHSPDASASDVSSNGCESPDRGRISLTNTSPRVSNSRKHGTSEISGKIGELTQQESKMSSECSSDETVIFVMKPTETERMINSNRNKTNEDNDDNDVDEDVDEDSQERGCPDDIAADARKILPKIYSAVNSVSSQDSGINLSFHENDSNNKSSSIDLTELKRSSSAESNSTNSYGRKSRTAMSSNAISNLAGKSSSKQLVRQNDDLLSEDEEVSLDLREEKDDHVDIEGGFKFDGKDEDKNVSTRVVQWHSAPRNIWKPTVEAIQEFDMIRDNDRVLLCLSILGKDSLSLLHTLHQYRLHARSKGIDFEIGAATIDTGEFNRVESIRHLKALDVPYFYEELIVDTTTNAATNETQNQEPLSNEACSFCNRSIRAQLYTIAKRHGYNVLALGQHLDDLTEGFLSSVFHSGQLKTMKAHYYIRRQDLRVIRPFVYVSEKALRQFARSKRLVPHEFNKSADLSEKQKQSKDILIQQERAYPRIYWSVRTALRPLIISHGQLPEFDMTCSNSSGNMTNSPSSSSGVSSISTASNSNATTSTNNSCNNQQKRYRRTKTNSLSSTSSSGGGGVGHHLSNQRLNDDNNDETDEEPVL
ncbi:PREDICTED: uncharacterized protein LOC106787160 [Polistes canadensis]|uniref:uncharacterized protein LOC106787160 n=1 Tax=Polistes canadensis TaxID=91411 RepID=UPI000718CE00|nr:PREDICTED: uncharacterized protein LOC106787160 [Polistes canadensis]